jgi:hypothetical protein
LLSARATAVAAVEKETLEAFGVCIIEERLVTRFRLALSAVRCVGRDAQVLDDVLVLLLLLLLMLKSRCDVTDWR